MPGTSAFDPLLDLISRVLCPDGEAGACGVKPLSCAVPCRAADLDGPTVDVNGVARVPDQSKDRVRAGSVKVVKT